jgi:hypothetical protein
MNKHTKGSWYVSAGLQVSSENGNIAKVWAKGNGEGSSNARLIAAAPDLLNALTVLADACERMAIPVDAARAAIAKARGE